MRAREKLRNLNLTSMNLKSLAASALILLHRLNHAIDEGDFVKSQIVLDIEITSSILHLSIVNLLIFSGFYIYVSNISCIFAASMLNKRTNMETATLQSTPFTPFQIEMLEMVSRVTSEREMSDIRQMLGRFFAQRAEDAIDRLWDEGVINEDVIEGWKNEHMRTPYKQ